MKGQNWTCLRLKLNTQLQPTSLKVALSFSSSNLATDLKCPTAGENLSQKFWLDFFYVLLEEVERLHRRNLHVSQVERPCQ